MNTSHTIIEKISSQINTISLSGMIYTKEAVISASNKFNEHFFIKIDVCENNDFKIIFENKNGNEIDNLAEVKLKEFCNEVLEQQERENLNKQFGSLRDSIYQKAFSSIND